MREKTFCISCGQLIPTNLLGKIQGYEFEEGFYCVGCAKERVKKARSKGGDKK